MIETATSYPADLASVEKMKDDIEMLQNTIVDLQKSYQTALDTNSSLNKLLSEKKNLIDNAKVIIVDAFDADHFSKTAFEEIADALNIELTKEVNVTINVTFSGTVDVPLGFDIEGNLENFIDFEATASGYGNVDIECDLYTDGVDVSVYER